MSVHINYWEWKSGEECLQWLFENHLDMEIYKCIRVWQESFATLGNGNLAGSYQPLYPKMLEGRVYSVFFVDDSIGIRYHDRIFAPSIPNRTSGPNSWVTIDVPTITVSRE